MINCEVKFGVAEVANIFKVHRDVVKAWGYHFSEYLDKKANPGKGITREFTLKDVRILAYVFSYWEDDPDIDYIKIGLNQGGHWDERFNNLVAEVTPLFHDLPEDFEPGQKRGVLFGGVAENGDMFELANSYKLAGDRLIEIALANEEEFDLFCPAINNYRHATELYLKESFGIAKQSHKLLPLLEKFNTIRFRNRK